MFIARKLNAVWLLAAACCVSGCGGGSGGDMVSVPPPVPLPTPAPTPTPTPPPPPAIASTYFSTSHASVAADAVLEKLADGSVRLAAIKQVKFAGAPTFGNFEIRGPNSYAVEFYGFGGPEFPPSSYLGSNAAFERYRAVDQDGHFANLDLARKDAGIALTYSTFGNVAYSTAAPSEVEITFFAAGSRTESAQMPRTGSASYQGIADGLWIDHDVVRRLYGSAARLTADFATGRLSSVLELRGHGQPFGDFASTPTTTLGTFTGSGTISGAMFQGTYDPTTAYSGQFVGQFFGPGAEEAGWSFRLTGAAGQLVFGAAAAKQ